MSYKLKNKQKGFTIIEVMIVLAIAGLIMLIVFLAVPNLQRSSRNTGRRNDASRLAAAVNNFVANNNGTAPSTSANVTTIINDAGALNQYSSTTFAVANPLGTAAANRMSLVDGSGGAVSAITVDGFQLVTGAKCGTSGATTNSGASSKSMALQYAQESNGGSFTGACLDI